MVCPHGQGGRGGWASADILRTRGKVGSIFHDFVRMSFMDGPLGLLDVRAYALLFVFFFFAINAIAAFAD